MAIHSTLSLPAHSIDDVENRLLRPIFRNLVRREEEITGLDMSALSDSLAREFVRYLLAHGGEIEVEQDLMYHDLLVNLKFSINMEDVKNAED